ncbi:hypothetical protein CkaCkLH20_09088 [Colletotrichum karsti]|uniref:Uncharacterized protein n=1 Tax=Colletotrichum karsti TaxID=1095194 RepID=A0A9P6HZZ2_9PEZI|nr:uncharacterized protein CkaCkLH20_09088 [Colletotrichum karsti]KAF9873275.1 hypothetical protein CkaCkLH20_09088 [Colletotrichum karsti]
MTDEILSDDVIEALLRPAGISVRAAGPFFGTGTRAQVSLRLMNLDATQKRFKPSALAVIKRVTYWVDKAINVSPLHPDLDHNDNAFWDAVIDVADDDKTLEDEIKLHTCPSMKRAAIAHIVQRFRFNRNNFLRSQGNVAAPDADAPDNETEEQRLKRVKMRFYLGKMWKNLDDRTEVCKAFSRCTRDAKRANRERPESNEPDVEPVSGATADPNTNNLREMTHHQKMLRGCEEYLDREKANEEYNTLAEAYDNVWTEKANLEAALAFFKAENDEYENDGSGSGEEDDEGQTS